MFCNDLDSNYYKTLYDLESYLRFIVKWEVRGNYVKDWEGVLSAEINKGIRDKESQEREFRYVTHQATGYFSYLTISELKDIILGPLWAKNFTKYWGSHDVVSGDFKKLIAVRNKIGHFRSLTSRDAKIIDDFIYYLESWTDNYSNTYRFASVFLNGDININKEKWSDSYKKTTATWIKYCGLNKLTHTSEFKKRGNYFSLSLSQENGSYKPDLVIQLFLKNSKYIPFFKVNELSNILIIYVPLGFDDSIISTIIEEVFEVANEIENYMSSDELFNRYQKLSNESIIPWGFTIPSRFKK